MKIIKGDLIKLALEGKFDVIAHGCNCFCTMGAGIAPQMAKAFGCDGEEFGLHSGGALESMDTRGDYGKLGNITFEYFEEFTPQDVELPRPLYVVNAYTQYGFSRKHSNGAERPLDYTALELCFKKMNHIFKGMHIGLPWIGCGLAGGAKHLVERLIEICFTDCEVTIVEYDK